MSRQRSLGEFGAVADPDLSGLTDAERAAYVAVRVNGVGMREHARETDRSPGTVGNLLDRAERKIGGGPS